LSQSQKSLFKPKAKILYNGEEMNRKVKYFSYSIIVLIISFIVSVFLPQFLLLSIFACGLILFYLFVRYFSDKKTKWESELFIYFLFLIFLYGVLKFLTIKFANFNLEGYNIIADMSQIFDSTFVSATILAAYAYFTLLMFLEMRKTRKEERKNSKENMQEISNEMKNISAELKTISRSLEIISQKDSKKLKRK